MPVKKFPRSLQEDPEENSREKTHLEQQSLERELSGEDSFETGVSGTGVGEAEAGEGEFC